MPGSGTRTFLDPAQYEASLRQAHIDLVLTCGGEFQARLTWAELHRMQLLRCEEDAARIGLVSFAAPLTFISFPAASAAMPVWRGTEMQARDLVFHSLGDRLHQTTSGASGWSVIALHPGQLEEYGRVLSEKPLPPPRQGRVLRLASRDAVRLRRLHAQACRLAETRPKILTHPEVARAIEQGLIHALVPSLVGAKVQKDGAVQRHHARIMVRFEEVLTERLDQPLRMLELCELIGVSEPILRSCCAKFLGVTPNRYALLRRLKQVRSALREADPDHADVAQLARRFGFTELGRFAGEYRAVFGETPSATLQRAADPRFSRS